MSVSITMIGTGSAFANAYNNNNAIIEVDGYRLLVDCGITAPSALHKLDIAFGDLDAVLISHTHADHVGGLEELAFQMKFVHQRTPVLYIPAPLRDPLWEHTLKGGLVQGALQSLDDFFEVRELTVGEPAELAPGLVIEPIRTEHIEGRLSYSFLINEQFFYSADMIFNPGLLQQLVDERGVRHIFHDCQLTAPGTVHACLDELLTLPAHIQSIIRLMHYGDTMPEYVGRTGPMSFVEQGKTYDI
ncbi:ribonuclease BN (tRNA processing enzyme) [Paenibacillus cellulosilyticus]|uniref:Ribonuclease BN (tRNA processing enzyme) n=1 Tax=Paenibacillus cellulosilyticus TaxID=375489 RepID=A0A2V2YWJ7_9BACL|nr:MBL fold metallo-hydrolase [Paenibacillus cellulosilyticus]PWW06117.1 ribonuclease BN (tRNA processing enzyme) [Paenibacillus cellulosilyticus]QKS43109.1 MBL fold metallo-hydrolase [Paenibacillus cellulosilyticus]